MGKPVMFGWLRRQLDSYGRSGAWRAVRQMHLDREPACAACGRKKDLEVHHIKPYHEHPELELDDGTNGFDGNLITLCRDPCHFYLGHLMRWDRSNSHIREDAATYRRRMAEVTPRSTNDHLQAG